MAQVASEPVDDRLFVEITHANGRKSRWSPDEPDASGIPDQISFGNSAPGGHKDFSCALVRDPRKDWPDLDLFDGVRVYGRTAPLGRSAFEGRQEGFPSELGERFGIAVNAIGHQAALEDDGGFIPFYIDRDMSHLQDATLARRAQLAAGGSPQGRIPVSISQGGIVWDPPGEALAVNEVTEVMYLAPAGHTIAKLGYKGKRDGTWTNFEAATLFTDDTESLPSPGSVVLTLDDAVREATVTTPERYGMLRARVTTGVTPGAGVQQRLSALSVVANHGLSLQQIGDGTTDPKGLYGHDVLGHMLTRGAPELTYEIGRTIARITDFVLPDFAFLEPTLLADAIQKLNAYYLYPWAVWDNKEFWWQPWDPGTLTWKARIQGGAQWRPAGRQASTLYNGVVVVYTDHAGQQRTAGPPGSGCDTESALLEDTDLANPVNSHGKRRWAKLDVGFPLTSGAAGSAVQLGYVWLQEAKYPQRSGELVVRPLGAGHIPQIEHPTIGPVPVWAVRAGDFVQLDDFPDREPFKVLEASYDHASKTLRATLDNTTMKLSAILERVGVRLIGKI